VLCFYELLGGKVDLFPSVANVIDALVDFGCMVKFTLVSDFIFAMVFLFIFLGFLY
jgi:hypothetical protein